MSSTSRIVWCECDAYHVTSPQIIDGGANFGIAYASMFLSWFFSD